MSKSKFQSPLSLPRRGDGSLLPALLVAFLLALAVMQFLLPEPQDIPRSVAPAITVARPEPPGFAPTSIPAAIIANALFAPARGTSGGGGDTATSIAVAGTVTVARSRYAVVIALDGSLHRLAPGGVVDGWRLVSLGADRARFARQNEIMNVPYGAKASASAQNPEESGEE
jgi:hypothetical protein